MGERHWEGGGWGHEEKLERLAGTRSLRAECAAKNLHITLFYCN